MTILSWKPEYSVGDAEIDDQHQQLFLLVNTLHAAVLGNFSRQRVLEILSDLVQHTEYHFHTEEVKMSEIGYTDLCTHRDQHHNLLRRLKEIETLYFSSDLTLGGELFTFIVGDLLLNHMLHSDKKYAPLINTSRSVAEWTSNER